MGEFELLSRISENRCGRADDPMATMHVTPAARISVLALVAATPAAIAKLQAESSPMERILPRILNDSYSTNETTS